MFIVLTGYSITARSPDSVLAISVLATAFELGIPVFTSSPGDSSIGMNVAAMALRDAATAIDSNRDVNQTAAIVYDAKSRGRASSVFILGGGSPKNFMLQTEPQRTSIQNRFFGLLGKGFGYPVFDKVDRISDAHEPRIQ